MITLALFAVLVVVLTPLLHRDMSRAAKRRSERHAMQALARDYGHRVRALGAAAGQFGLSAALAGSWFRKATAAARDAEQSMAKLAAVLGVSGSEVRYQLRLEHERSLGRAYVGILLDDMCRSYGWDPVEVWRAPRAADEWRRRTEGHAIRVREPHDDRLDAMAYSYWALSQMPLAPTGLVSGSGA